MYISAVCLCDDWCVNHSCVFDVEGHLDRWIHCQRFVPPFAIMKKKKSVMTDSVECWFSVSACVVSCCEIPISTLCSRIRYDMI